MPTVCEIKVALKAKGIKGISGLNKSGLQSLLNKGGSNQEPKEPPKPKPFVPAPTKGESPKVAEKQIDKKVKPPKPPKILMLTNKQVKEKKEPKPKKQTKQMKFYEEHKSRIDGFMKSPRNVLLSKLSKVEALMTGASTDAEKKQATMQYEILNTAIKMKK
jgi:outer membrane biosynthesis protein TonB